MALSCGLESRGRLLNILSREYNILGNLQPRNEIKKQTNRLIMKEKEFKLIIDRERHEKDAQTYLSKHTELLIDFINYGSSLIPRVYDSSNKKLEDIVVIAVLLKQVVAMIDAVEVLISKGAVSTSHLQARAAFEASLYIDWILQGDSEKKAKYYYVANLRNQRLWALRFKTGTPEEQIFSKAFEDIEKYIQHDDRGDLEKLADSEINKIDSLLSMPGWVEISNEFERVKNKKTGMERDWYKLFGVTSIRELAKRVGRLGEYDLFYTRCSEVMHGASYKNHIQFRKGTIAFEPVRQLRDVHLVLRFILLTAISTYISIIRHYRYGELSHFRRKYLQDWRRLFLNLPSVSYNIEVDNLL